MQDHQPSSQTAQGLHKIGLILRQHAWKDGHEQGISPTQAQVLIALQAERGGGLRLSSIAATLAVTPATASDAVSALEAKGLLTKAPDPDDRRAISITLTSKGRREARGIGLWPDALLEAIDTLDSDEHAVFQRTLIKLIHTLQTRGAIPTARMCVNCTYFRPNASADTRRPHYCAYVDAPIGDSDLRIDCDDVEILEEPQRQQLWQVFVEGQSA